MEVFNYESIGIFAKYAKEIYIGSLILVAVIAVIAIFINLLSREKGIFGKIISLLIIAAVAVGLYFVSGWIYNANSTTYEKIQSYKAAYESGEVKQISGTVEEFASYTDRKTFTLAGEDFIVYASDAYKLPADDLQTIVHYVYNSGGSTVNYNGFTNNFDISYKPEECLISENKKLELHYIVEFGEKRILYIKELP